MSDSQDGQGQCLEADDTQLAVLHTTASGDESAVVTAPGHESAVVTASGHESAVVKPSGNESALVTVSDHDSAVGAASGHMSPSGASVGGSGARSAIEILETPEKVEQPDEFTRGEAIAIANYADAKKVPSNQVTIADVENSEEGIFYWASVQGDWTARGRHGQAFARAMQHTQAAEARGIYPWLDGPLAREFRQKWSIRQDFEFVTEERVITSEYKKTDTELGKLVTKAQLAVALGINAYPPGSAEHTAVMHQTDQYFTFAKDAGGMFYAYNAWLDADTVMLVDKLLSIKCSKSWATVARQHNSISKWEQAAKECKARRAFAVAKNLHLDQVSLGMVAASAEGVQGWSETAVSVSSGSRPSGGGGGGGVGTGTRGEPRTPRAKAKAKARASGDGSKSVSQHEKELKHLISKEMSVQEDTASFKNKLEKTSDIQWCHAYLGELDEYTKSCSMFRENSDFLRSFEKSCLSTDATKRLRKESGLDYQAKLIRCIDGLEEPLAKASEVLEKMNSMGMAASPEIFVTPKKGKQGTKRRLPASAPQT